MSDKRYFKRMWEEEYYLFDSQAISENEFDEKVEYEGYQAFADSMMGDEVVNRLNEQHEENKELKEDNDIKFWKHELMVQWNKTQIISHELSIAIENGYEISEDFKKYLDELKERHEENMKKAERLKI